MKKPFIFIFFIMAFSIVLISVNSKFKNNIKVNSAYAMGTEIKIIIAEKNINENIFDKAFTEFKRVEGIFKDNLNMQNHEVKKLYSFALDLQNLSNGGFSPFLSDVIKLWQFDKTTKTITKIPTEDEILKALNSKNVNLYAVAKGYGIDMAAKILQQNNIHNFIINAGGDLYVSGTKNGKPWNIGIKDSKYQLSCNLQSYAIATSSNLYNSYTLNNKKYGHLINGNTGWPINTEKSISIIAKNATIADGYSTAAFVAEQDITKTLKSKGISLLKLTQDNFNTFNLSKNCNVKKIQL